MRRLLLLMLASKACCASGVPRLTLAEMVGTSEYIVEGSVLRSWSAWDAPHRSIWTHYELSVDDWLKAPTAVDRTIVVSEPGGTADGITMRVEDAIPYVVGEKVVVLAWRTEDGYLRAAGNGQGKFTVAGFAESRQARLRVSPQVIEMLRGARELEERLDGMRLDDFKHYVRSVVRFEGERTTAQ